ncbi:MAG TPA: dienelactone hydrolase family protein [Solirubrobacteraceae bacterium]|nr:dienelactone hydrolase family protein [Solirubrobacteraceae bacterium]
MQHSTIEVKTPDGVADAYLVRPDGEAPLPGVLLVIDAFGLRPRIQEMADRIAEQGYVVLAPNLFYRAGRAPLFELPDLTDPDTRAAFFAELRPLMEALTPEAVEADGRAYLAALAQYARGPAGITGYCLGARIALRLAATYPDRVAAVGGFHGGRLVTDDPQSPHRGADRIRAELYFGHADNDESNTPEQIAALDAALETAGVRHRSDVYTGATHGYTMADTAAYDEAATERHFENLFALLGRTLG